MLFDAQTCHVIFAPSDSCFRLTFHVTRISIYFSTSLLLARESIYRMTSFFRLPRCNNRQVVSQTRDPLGIVISSIITILTLQLLILRVALTAALSVGSKSFVRLNTDMRDYETMSFDDFSISIIINRRVIYSEKEFFVSRHACMFFRKIAEPLSSRSLTLNYHVIVIKRVYAKCQIYFGTVAHRLAQANKTLRPSGICSPSFNYIESFCINLYSRLHIRIYFAKILFLIH